MNTSPLIQPANDQTACGHRGSHHQAPSSDVRFALPTGSLLVSIVVGVLLVAGGWATVASFMKDERSAFFVTGMAGIGVVAVMSMLGVIVMTPWKQRSMIDWMTMWLLGTVFRVLATPIVAYVLYSAFSPPTGGGLSAKPLALSVAIAYMVALFVEAAVLSTYLKRFCPPLPPIRTPMG